MNRCGTCKHWGGEDEERACHRAYDVERPCQKIDHLHALLEKHRGSQFESHRIGEFPAYLMDGSGYAATLYTRHDFGCVLWDAYQPGDEA